MRGNKLSDAVDPLFASSLAHGLSLLDAFVCGPAGLTNKQLAERTGLSKASISRLTTTLATRGLLAFDTDTRKHRLGSTMLTLAYPLLASLGVRRLARLPMKRLSDELGGTVSLGMRDRTRMVYVESSRSNDLVSFRPDVGAVLPMLQSALGRAWLAAATQHERTAVLQTIGAESPTELIRWGMAVKAAQADLVARGYCISRGDWRPDVHAVAVPLDVMLAGERLVLNCGMPTRRLTLGNLEARVAPKLLSLARLIEADWHAELSGEGVGEAAARLSPFPAAPLDSRPADDPSDRQIARTLARGIDLLLCFQPTDDALGNGELARRLGLSPTTVVRLTFTLTQLGYLRRDADGARYPRYRLGAATLATAYPMLCNLRLRERARPAILALADRVGGSVALGLRHQTGMVYVENAWRTDNRLIPPDMGTPMPMMASAMGRAWLAGAEPAERDAVLNQIRVHDPATYARHGADVARAQRDYQRLGYCWSRDVRPEVEAFGVPLSNPVDGVRYVMNCGVLAPSPLPARRARAVGEALAEVVREVEHRLDP